MAMALRALAWPFCPVSTMLRVISLFYLGQWNTQVFNFAHEYLWQALIMLDVLIVWLLWIRAGNKAAPSPASPDAATAV